MIRWGADVVAAFHKPRQMSHANSGSRSGNTFARAREALMQHPSAFQTRPICSKVLRWLLMPKSAISVKWSPARLTQLREPARGCKLLQKDRAVQMNLADNRRKREEGVASSAPSSLRGDWPSNDVWCQRPVGFPEGGEEQQRGPGDPGPPTESGKDLTTLPRMQPNNESNVAYGTESFVGVFYSQMIVASLGICLNLLVFFIGCFSIKGSYRHYLSNLAVVDTLFAVGALVTIIDFHFSHLPVWIRELAKSICSLMVPPMSVALVPISVDRYLKICARNKTRRCQIPIPMVCIFADVFPLITLMTFKVLNFSDRLTNSFYMVIIPVSSLLIVLCCNIALFCFISRHVTVIASLENRRRLNETKQLVRATCIQAVTPLCMQLPSLLGIFSIMTNDEITDGEHADIVWYLANIFWLIIVFNPLVDAIVTLFVVRSYRNAARDYALFILPNCFFTDYRRQRFQRRSVTKNVSRFSNSQNEALDSKSNNV
uniref:G_PROTEIN_RECEP_F1_2 domain-containing protein n=1 Tax=Steinernema glaseri TaxID=37863 RepID=A0A1I8AGS2_9BILA